MVKKYDLVALGGTFDILHKGHNALISKAFSVSFKVIVGLTSDELATKRGKNLVNRYERRKENLTLLIDGKFPSASYEICKLENEFGPAILEVGVQALVVSEETAYQGDRLNKIRREKSLPAVDVVVVPMVLAEDGTRISTTRIKNAEVDAAGKQLSSD